MAFDDGRVAQLFDKLDRQLTKLSSNPQPKSVHQFRTAARRVETFLSELTPQPDRKQRKLLKSISKLRRRAGRVRDLDVQIAAVRSLKVSDQPAIKTQLLQSMAEMRSMREERLLQLLDKKTVRELHRRLRQEHDLAPQRAHDFKMMPPSRLANLATHSGPITEKLLHRFRIEGKKMRYIAELAADNPNAQHAVEELKRMQDVLGEWHDWLTLDATVSKILPKHVNSPLLAAISNIKRAKYRDALQAVTNTKRNLLKKPVALATRTKDTAAMAQAVA
jgi:CHAD domain-containing protein